MKSKDTPSGFWSGKIVAVPVVCNFIDVFGLIAVSEDFEFGVIRPCETIISLSEVRVCDRVCRIDYLCGCI